jgi:CheY-like chemotaxis protein
MNIRRSNSSTTFCENIAIDAIILDYHMPEMEGAELARRIGQDTRYDQILVIMLTSMDYMEDGQLFSSLGVQTHLNKSARSAVLLKTLVDLMELDPANGEAIAAAKLMRAVA